MSGVPTSNRKLAAIMFADIVGYTAMMQEDESNAVRLRGRYREVVEIEVGNHAGEIVQFYGDGALCIFPSAKESVLCAQGIQQSLQKDPRVPVRIGIHIGDILQDQTGIFGDGVNVASRIESMAIPGSIFLSEKVQQELENHPSICVVSLGSFNLKNVKRPVRVFALDQEGVVVPSGSDLGGQRVQDQETSIAVLPFVSKSTDREGEYLADGISEEISNGLTKVGGLAVISRMTCLALRDCGENMGPEARRLGVSFVLDGSVRKAGDRVRVSVQLVNAGSGHQLWSESFDRIFENIFDIQDEISHHVVNFLKVNFDLQARDEPIVSQATQNLEAYNLYLKGLHHWNKRNPDASRKAAEIFERVIEMDPEFSQAHCALSNCFSFLGSCGVMEPDKAYSRALALAVEAIERDPKLPEAHLAMAALRFFHFWDWDGTRSSLEKAHNLGLNSALMHQIYGLFYAAVGQLPEGVRHMEKALRQDPISIPVIDTLCKLYVFNEQYEEALGLCDEILELDPTFRGAVQTKGIIYMCQGRREEGLREFKTYHRMVNHPLKGLTCLALAYGELDDEEKLEDCVQKMKLRQEQDPSASMEIDFAIIHCGLHNYDQALEYLNRVYEKRFSIMCLGMIWVMRCPYFHKLWEQPGYRKLLGRMGLEQ